MKAQHLVLGLLVTITCGWLSLGPCLGANQTSPPAVTPPGPAPEVIPDWQARLELARILSYMKRYDESIAEYEQVLKEKPDLLAAKAELARVLFWSGQTDKAFKMLRPIPLEDLDDQSRAVPCLSWEPMYIRNGQEVVIDYERIVKGEYDLYLEEFAKQAKLWGKPLLIRFAHEMNLERYHWGTTTKGRYGPRSPEIYQSMFRYVVTYFRTLGVDNVLWVFCPNSESIPHPVRDQALWNQASNYYPGDAYVDVLGMDGYNWGTTQTVKKNGWQSQWLTFREIFEPLYRELKALSPHKPIVVCEIASTDQGGDKSAWIKEAWATAKAWEVKGLIWFQLKKEVDWNINRGTHYSYVPLIQEAMNAPAWITELKKQ